MSPLGTYVLETVATLIAIVVLAVLVLYAARRLGVGAPRGPVQLVGRLPLEARRAIYLVRVERTVYVVGASEAGLEKLGEIEASALDLGVVHGPSATFSETLSRALGRRRGTDDAR